MFFFKSRSIEIKVSSSGEEVIRILGYSVDETLHIMKVAEAFVTNIKKHMGSSEERSVSLKL